MTNDSERAEILGTALLAVCAFLACAVIVCLACALEYVCSRPAPLEVETPEAEVCAVSYRLPDGSSQSLYAEPRKVIACAPEVSEPGYTLVAWRDENGTEYSPELPAEFHGGVTLTAVLMPALETGQHIAYMPLRGQTGMFEPDEVLTRLELAECAAALLAVEVNPTECFISTFSSSRNRNTSYNVLKTLGAMRGERFDPDSRVWLRELVSVFAAFFPRGAARGFANISSADPDYGAFCTAVARGWLEGESAFTVNPNAPVTRGEAAHFINRVLGREAAPQNEKLSGVFADVPPSHPYRDDIMESAVVHNWRLSGGAEQWTRAEAVPRLEEGMYRDGALLRCIGRNGYILKNGGWGNGFMFDEDGVYTSGMPELDELVLDVLEELGTGDMEDMDALRAVYNYTRDSFTYLRRNYYSTGATGWGEQEAYTMLSTGYGNCYCYAATFYELARALGFDVRLISGTVGTNRAPHGWVELDVDGKRYVCDTELEMTYYRDNKPTKPDMFMMPDIMSSQWSYIR